MNLPNKLTTLRIGLTFAFMLFLFLSGIGAKILAMFIFLAACVTDALDGFIARKNNQVTDFGKLMDPIADKILVLSAFAAFVQMQLVKDWMFMIIISRELVITYFRLFALNKGKVMSAGKMGKGKTVSQMVIIFVILGFIVFKEVMLAYFTWNPAWESMFHQGIDAFMWVILALTIYSGCSYLWQNRKIITNI